MAEFDHIVLGAGVFGASTALHLAKDPLKSKILLLDSDNSSRSASIDINKVVRREYASSSYSLLADEAIQAWQQGDFEEFYHRCSWVMIHTNRETSLRRSGIEMTHDELRQRFGSIFESSRLENEDKIMYNESVAWVEAAKALRRTVELACSAGVSYEKGEARDLSIQNGNCVGVNLVDGRHITTRNVIVAMGAWTGPFMARHCQIHVPQSLFSVASVTTATISLGQSEIEKYKQMPMIVCPRKGEIMPTDSDGRIKITNANSFTNNDMMVSGPIKKTPAIPRLYDENRKFLEQYLPQFKDRPFSDSWYCYDCVAPHQDFIISPVPDISGLYVVGGGSYHAFKFLPIIGKYVVKMLKGNLSKEWEERWKWDRSGKTQIDDVHGDIIPRRIVSFPAAANQR